MKIFIFFSFLLFFNNSYAKSNDSPNLNYKNENLISWNQWKENLKKELTKYAEKELKKERIKAI